MMDQLSQIQKTLASHVKTSSISTNQVKKIAGFDIVFTGRTAICGACVLEFPSLKLVERKILKAEAPMKYIPELLAFREGPLIVEAYHDLESEPDVIMIDDHGILHPQKCGVATYVGVELDKPTIGVAKGLIAGEVKEDKVFLNGELLGQVIKTREHSNPLFVSIGNKIKLDVAAEIAKRCVVYPHKLPEPIHMAHKVAKKQLQQPVGEVQQEEDELEYDIGYQPIE
jgi:deoxyribonuclease V